MIIEWKWTVINVSSNTPVEAVGITITNSRKTTHINAILYKREILTVFNYDLKTNDTLIPPKVCPPKYVHVDQS